MEPRAMSKFHSQPVAGKLLRQPLQPGAVSRSVVRCLGQLAKHAEQPGPALQLIESLLESRQIVRLLVVTKCPRHLDEELETIGSLLRQAGHHVRSRRAIKSEV